MCDLCVINTVKDRMLSRRDLFRGAAAAAVTGGAAAAGSSAIAAPQGGVVDMSHPLDEDFPTFGGEPGVSRAQVASLDSDGYNLLNLTLDEHSSTHLDAPLHFSADGRSVDELTIQDLIAPLCVVDIADRAQDNPDAQLTPQDLRRWIAEYGEIPPNAIVALHSGWSEKASGARFRNADDQGVMHFPGFHPEAAMMLLEETQAGAIAVDTLSLDYGPSQDFATHYAWLSAGRFGIECLANLSQVPPAGATLIVGAMKVTGGTGGPARIFALT